jgi:hypothetical protein
MRDLGLRCRPPRLHGGGTDRRPDDTREVRASRPSAPIEDPAGPGGRARNCPASAAHESRRPTRSSHAALVGPSRLVNAQDVRPFSARALRASRDASVRALARVAGGPRPGSAAANQWCARSASPGWWVGHWYQLGQLVVGQRTARRGRSGTAGGPVTSPPAPCTRTRRFRPATAGTCSCGVRLGHAPARAPSTPVERQPAEPDVHDRAAPRPARTSSSMCPRWVCGGRPRPAAPDPPDRPSPVGAENPDRPRARAQLAGYCSRAPAAAAAGSPAWPRQCVEVLERG